MTRTLGLDLGGTKLLGVVVDEHDEIVASRQCPTLRDEGPEAVMARVLGLARALATQAGPLEAAGIGFAGLVDPVSGVARSSVILPGWHDVPLAAPLSDALGLPALADNDATVAGLGEYAALGSPAGVHLVVVTVGTGIGAALILDGRPFRGADGLAGELGNTTIDWHGETCWCGNQGCLNTLASGTALAATASRLALAEPHSSLHGRQGLTLQDVSAAAAEGDALARRVLTHGAQALGAGLANVANLLNPHRIGLCGGVIELGPDWLEQVRTTVRRRAFDEICEHLVVEACVLGPRSGAFGAARLARDGIAGT